MSRTISSNRCPIARIRCSPAAGPDHLVGTADSLLEAFRAWEAEGVTEIMCRMEKPTVDLVEEIAEAARRLRG